MLKPIHAIHLREKERVRLAVERLDSPESADCDALLATLHSERLVQIASLSQSDLYRMKRVVQIALGDLYRSGRELYNSARGWRAQALVLPFCLNHRRTLHRSWLATLHVDVGTRVGGERDFGLCDHPPESSGVDEFVNVRSSILYTGVGEQGGWALRVRNRFAGLEENLQCFRRIEPAEIEDGRPAHSSGIALHRLSGLFE